MKAGDRLYCYCDFTYLKIIGGKDIVFKKGNIYEVHDTSIDDVVILKSDNGIDEIFFIKDENKDSFIYYKDWFYTEQELRKLKLDKLNENK